MKAQREFAHIATCELWDLEALSTKRLSEEGFFFQPGTPRQWERRKE